jgi:hypothetical protein
MAVYAHGTLGHREGAHGGQESVAGSTQAQEAACVGKSLVRLK